MCRVFLHILFSWGWRKTRFCQGMMQGGVGDGFGYPDSPLPSFASQMPPLARREVCRLRRHFSPLSGEICPKGEPWGVEGLAAARSTRDSDSPPDCHSLPLVSLRYVAPYDLILPCIEAFPYKCYPRLCWGCLSIKNRPLHTAEVCFDVGYSNSKAPVYSW